MRGVKEENEKTINEYYNSIERRGTILLLLHLSARSQTNHGPRITIVK